MKLSNGFLIVVTAIITNTLSAISQPSLQWQKCYGGSDGDVFYQIERISNDKFIFIGSSVSNDGDVNFNHGNTDIWVLITDTMGNIIGQKCLGGTSDEGATSIKLDSGGVIYLVGGTSSNNGDITSNHQSGTFDGWFVNLDNSLSIQWQKCYGGSDNDGFSDLKFTKDKGYILVGTTSSNDGDVIGGGFHGGVDGWVVKLDSVKSIQWQKCYGGTGDDYLTDVFLTSDSGYIIAGHSTSADGDILSPLGLRDFWVMKISNTGLVQWSKSYGGTQDDLLVDMLETQDNGYAMVGRTSSRDAFVSGRFDTLTWQYDFWLLKIDSGGNFQWQKCYGGNGDDLPRSIWKTNNGGFLISGNTQSNDGEVNFNHGNLCLPSWCDDIWLIETDSIGVLQWQKCIGGSEIEFSGACMQLSNQGYLVAGLTYSSDYDATGGGNHGNGDAWAVKLSSLPDDINEDWNTLTDFSCHVNDEHHSIEVSFYSDKNEKAEFALYDMVGKVIFKKPIKMISGINTNEMWIGDLNRGLYLAGVFTYGKAVYKTVVVN